MLVARVDCMPHINTSQHANACKLCIQRPRCAQRAQGRWRRGPRCCSCCQTRRYRCRRCLAACTGRIAASCAWQGQRVDTAGGSDWYRARRICRHWCVSSKSYKKMRVSFQLCFLTQTHWTWRRSIRWSPLQRIRFGLPGAIAGAAVCRRCTARRQQPWSPASGQRLMTTLQSGTRCVTVIVWRNHADIPFFP